MEVEKEDLGSCCQHEAMPSVGWEAYGKAFPLQPSSRENTNSGPPTASFVRQIYYRRNRAAACLSQEPLELRASVLKVTILSQTVMVIERVHLLTFLLLLEMRICLQTVY